MSELYSTINRSVRIQEKNYTCISRRLMLICLEMLKYSICEDENYYDRSSNSTSTNISPCSWKHT